MSPNDGTTHTHTSALAHTRKRVQSRQGRPVPHGMTYKSKHRPPKLVRERVNKTPGAHIRSALMGTSHVNRTDVDTLRPSFGARPPVHLLPSLPLTGRIEDRDLTGQCGAARGSPQIRSEKGHQLKDTFERPFCTVTAGDVLITAAQCSRLPLPPRPPQPLHPLFPVS